MPSLAVALRRRRPAALAAALVLTLAVWIPELGRPAAVHRASAGLHVGDLKAFAGRTPPGLDASSPAALAASDVVGRLGAALVLDPSEEKALETASSPAVDAVRSRVKVSYADGKLTASAPDAKTAVAAANAWSRACALFVRALPRMAGDQARAEIARIRERLEAAELQSGPAERRREAASRRLDALDDADAELQRRAEELRAAQDRALARIKQIELLEHRLRESLPAGPEENGIASPLLDRLREERESIRAEIALKKLDRAPETPEALRLQGRLQDVLEEIRKELFAARDLTIVKLRNAVDALDVERRGLDERRLRLSLDRREAQEELGARDPGLEELAALRAQLAAAEETALAIDVAAAPVTLGEPAERAESRGGARGSVLAAGLGAGLLGGIATALLLQALDRRVRTPTDVRRALGLPTIAQIPVAAEPFLLRAHPEDPVARAFSVAAGVVRSYLEEREYRTVLVAGSAPGEGASVCAANLAVALARKGMAVVLVDARLASPSLGALFGLDEAWSLSSVLRGEETPADLPAPSADLPSLRVVPAGAASDLPPESLESGRFIEFLRVLRERHEVVILDAPSMREGGDPVTLAGLADTTVRVVRSGFWTDGALAWSRDVMANVRADVAGVLLTFAPADEEPGI